MISNIIRRLRDNDSSVRLTLIDSVSIMSSRISRPSFSLFLKPFMEAISVEQDQSSQIGSALCLASAIDASPDPDVAQLHRLVPRLMKLMKKDCFKAKPALLTLIGSIVSAGGASSRNLLEHLVPVLVEFLSSEDWAARKASAETLQRLAVAEKEMVSVFKSPCLSAFESRRYDRVKSAREAMVQMMEAWKEVPDADDELSQRFPTKSSSNEYGTDGGRNSVTHPARKFNSSSNKTNASPNRTSTTPVRERSPKKTGGNKSTPALFRKLERKKPANLKVEIAVSQTPPSNTVNVFQERGKRVEEYEEVEDNRRHRPETRRALFNRNSDDKMHKFGASRVVPLQVEEQLESTVVATIKSGDPHENQNASEDLSLIRRQLIQIENQQSSLMDLLQRFMGSSQNGMQSLETRVHGLEVALDGISYDLAVSTGRISNTEPSGTCCILPGAEFLSPKFWRRTEGRYSISRLLGSPLRASTNTADREETTGTLKLDSRRFRHQSGGGLVVNPLAEISGGPRQSPEVHLNRLPKPAFHGYEPMRGEK